MGIEPTWMVPQTIALPLGERHSGCGWNRTTDDFLMREAFYRLNYTTKAVSIGVEPIWAINPKV